MRPKMGGGSVMARLVYLLALRGVARTMPPEGMKEYRNNFLNGFHFKTDPTNSLAHFFPHKS